MPQGILSPIRCEYVFHNLYKRLIELDVESFNDMTATRWEQHRNGAFHKDSIMEVVDRYYQVVWESGAMGRELQRWPELDIDMEIEYTYIESWISGRLENLDGVFLVK